MIVEVSRQLIMQIANLPFALPKGRLRRLIRQLIYKLIGYFMHYAIALRMLFFMSRSSNVVVHVVNNIDCRLQGNGEGIGSATILKWKLLNFLVKQYFFSKISRQKQRFQIGKPQKGLSRAEIEKNCFQKTRIFLIRQEAASYNIILISTKETMYSSDFISSRSNRSSRFIT
jgi:hypothetical protein